MARHFMDLLRAKWSEGKFVCVGLDTDPLKIPQSLQDKHGGNYRRMVLDFNCQIIEATSKIACAYKINSAFYEAYLPEGLGVLQSTIAQIIKIDTQKVPVILDAKRADIGNTNEGYVKAAFDLLQADAITVHPYLGSEAMEPFLKRIEKGIFVLCRTSNKGSNEFQDFPFNGNCEPLYLYVAGVVRDQWNHNSNCGLVVGATFPEELICIRKVKNGNDLPILIPGIGAQGGDLEKTLAAGFDENREGILINSSRGIIFASNGPDFAEAAAREAKKLHDQITQFREKGSVQ